MPTAGFTLTCSELLDSGVLGETHNGVRCENIERLTFNDPPFDLVTSTAALEHVEDDEAGFREIARVLRPGGYYVYTVPYTDSPPTIHRAKRQSDGAIEHFEEPEYHTDPFRGERGVFSWRNNGAGAVDTMARCGLDAEVRHVTFGSLAHLSVPMIVGKALHSGAS